MCNLFDSIERTYLEAANIMKILMTIIISVRELI